MTTITANIVANTTKTSIARPIFEQMKTEGYARKDILNMFVAQAGMTEQGAATSYYNFTKMMKEGKIKIEGVTVQQPVPPTDVEFDTMTDVEIVLFYTKYSPTPDTTLTTRDQVMEAIGKEILPTA